MEAPIESNRDRGIVAALLVAFVAAKLPTLSTPYYWDETSWIGFAHRLATIPLWRVLPGCHPAGMFGGRPPGLFASAATMFQITGPSIVFAHAYIVALAAVGVFYTYRLAAHLYGSSAGILAAAFLASNTLYFTQAGMFLGDLPVAACGVASVYHALRRQYGRYLLWAIYMVLLKETALAIVVAVGAYVALIERKHGFRTALRMALPWTVPVLLMSVYFSVQRLATGIWFVNYSQPFEIWEPQAVLPKAVLVTRWLFVEHLRWLFVLPIVVHLLADRSARRRPELVLFALIVLASGYSFSLLYFLPRYLLPVAPYLFVVAAGALVGLLPRPSFHWTVGGVLTLLLLARLTTSDRIGDRERDLGYLDVVRTYRQAASYLEREHPTARIATTWPLRQCLLRPELGYVHRELDSFTPQSDRGRADLALACQPSDSRNRPVDFAQARGWTALARFENDGATCTVYCEPSRAAASTLR